MVGLSPCSGSTAVLGERASPDFFHRFDPTSGTHGTSFAPFHVEAEARAADEAGEEIGYPQEGI
jgi:hypothetical protein